MFFFDCFCPLPTIDTLNWLDVDAWCIFMRKKIIVYYYLSKHGKTKGKENIRICGKDLLFGGLWCVAVVRHIITENQKNKKNNSNYGIFCKRSKYLHAYDGPWETNRLELHCSSSKMHLTHGILSKFDGFV